MNLTGQTTIYRKDFDKPAYSISVSKKKKDGTWMSAFIPVSFRKGVSVANKTKIDIKKAWHSVYEGKNGTVLTIFIDEFDTLSADIPSGFTQVDDSDIPF